MQCCICLDLPCISLRDRNNVKMARAGKRRRISGKNISSSNNHENTVEENINDLEKLENIDKTPVETQESAVVDIAQTSRRRSSRIPAAISKTNDADASDNVVLTNTSYHNEGLHDNSERNVNCGAISSGSKNSEKLALLKKAGRKKKKISVASLVEENGCIQMKITNRDSIDLKSEGIQLRKTRSTSCSKSHEEGNNETNETDDNDLKSLEKKNKHYAKAISSIQTNCKTDLRKNKHTRKLSLEQNDDADVRIKVGESTKIKRRPGRPKKNEIKIFADETSNRLDIKTVDISKIARPRGRPKKIKRKEEEETYKKVDVKAKYSDIERDLTSLQLGKPDKKQVQVELPLKKESAVTDDLPLHHKQEVERFLQFKNRLKQQKTKSKDNKHLIRTTSISNTIFKSKIARLKYGVTYKKGEENQKNSIRPGRPRKHKLKRYFATKKDNSTKGKLKSRNESDTKNESATFSGFKDITAEANVQEGTALEVDSITDKEHGESQSKVKRDSSFKIGVCDKNSDVEDHIVQRKSSTRTTIKLDYKRSLNPRLIKTDFENPYKKSYFIEKIIHDNMGTKTEPVIQSPNTQTKIETRNSSEIKITTDTSESSSRKESEARGATDQLNTTPTKSSTRSSVMKIDYRRSLDPRINKTDHDNPYRKAYFVEKSIDDNKDLIETPKKLSSTPTKIKRIDNEENPSELQKSQFTEKYVEESNLIEDLEKTTPTKPSTRSSLTKIDYKRSLNPRIIKTDLDNPYKKSYFIEKVTQFDTQTEKLEGNSPRKLQIKTSDLHTDSLVEPEEDSVKLRRNTRPRNRNNTENNQTSNFTVSKSDKIESNFSIKSKDESVEPQRNIIEPTKDAVEPRKHTHSRTKDKIADVEMLSPTNPEGYANMVLGMSTIPKDEKIQLQTNNILTQEAIAKDFTRNVRGEYQNESIETEMTATLKPEDEIVALESNSSIYLEQEPTEIQTKSKKGKTIKIKFKRLNKRRNKKRTTRNEVNLSTNPENDSEEFKLDTLTNKDEQTDLQTETFIESENAKSELTSTDHKKIENETAEPEIPTCVIPEPNTLEPVNASPENLNKELENLANVEDNLKENTVEHLKSMETETLELSDLPAETENKLHAEIPRNLDFDIPTMTAISESDSGDIETLNTADVNDVSELSVPKYQNDTVQLEAGTHTKPNNNFEETENSTAVKYPVNDSIEPENSKIPDQILITDNYLNEKCNLGSHSGSPVPACESDSSKIDSPSPNIEANKSHSRKTEVDSADEPDQKSPPSASKNTELNNSSEWDFTAPPNTSRNNEEVDCDETNEKSPPSNSKNIEAGDIDGADKKSPLGDSRNVDFNDSNEANKNTPPSVLRNKEVDHSDQPDKNVPPSNSNSEVDDHDEANEISPPSYSISKNSDESELDSKSQSTHSGNIEVDDHDKPIETASGRNSPVQQSTRRNHTHINYRNILDPKIITLSNNPYKKTYLSYRKSRNIAFNTSNMKTPALSPNNKGHKSSAVVVKGLLEKAHNLKKKKQHVSPIKITIKAEANTDSRPRRKTKSTFDTDYVYAIKSSNKRKFDAIQSKQEDTENKKNTGSTIQEKPEPMEATPVEKSNTTSIEDLEMSAIIDEKSPNASASEGSPLRKKPRIKAASSPLFHLSPEKKKVKVKNATPERTVQLATLEDHTEQKVHRSLLNAIREKNESFKEFSALYDDDFSSVTSFEESMSKKNMSEENSLNETPIKSEDEEKDGATKFETKRKTESVKLLKLKAVKLKGDGEDDITFVDFNNRIVVFCGSCASCKRKEDCGKCKHCRCEKMHKTRVLPCWRRRCMYPTYGKTVEIKRRRGTTTSFKKKEIVKEAEKGKLKQKTTELVEKVELSVISDNTHLKTKKGDPSEPLQFKVNVQKNKGTFRSVLTSPTGRSNVFTGMSPMKPKLRSSMNELTKKSSNRQILPRVQYGNENLVKLPWPNDSYEDAAWVSGHHLCLMTANETTFFPSLCFLCGSMGQEKMVTCYSCCEMFHPYCLDVEPVDWENWCCDRCKRCTVCGYKENLLMCDHCHDCYHAECLGPFYQRDTEGIEETWVCGKCVKCKKCGRRTAGNAKTSRWMYNFSMCENCGKNWKRKNFCPVCEVLYQEDDDSLKMMFCSRCERWIHMECEEISNDDYEILAELPDNIPYECKLCMKTDKHSTAWYKEVKGELNSGFLKVYYGLISHRDFKQLKRSLTNDDDQTNEVICLTEFDSIFKNIESRKYNVIDDFYQASVDTISKISSMIRTSGSIDISRGIVPDASSLLPLFEKSLKTVFPWFNIISKKEEIEDENDKKIFGSKSNENDGNVSLDEETISLADEEALVHDHSYLKAERITATVDVNMDEDDGECEKDLRRCLFCNISGDDLEYGAGRLLYAGLDEWVHINCALWSAEVYEDDSGRLKHVNEAIKRGNKLKCEHCGRYGASIGCCFLKCPKSYHFNCAKKSHVVFQDDKKIYCEDHAMKANKLLVLAEKELTVPRRVLVDLVRYKSVKRIQRGLDPTFIQVLCGTLRLNGLGHLSEQSDSKHVLMPIGYKVTRVFWSTKNPKTKCKYKCEIQLKGDKEEAERKKEASTEQDQESVTYCHDKKEWDMLVEKSECSCDVEKLREGSVKRKLYPQKCEKCLRNQKFDFIQSQLQVASIISSLHKTDKKKIEKKKVTKPKKEKMKDKEASSNRKMSKKMTIGSKNPDFVQQLCRASVTAKQNKTTLKALPKTTMYKSSIPISQSHFNISESSKAKCSYSTVPSSADSLNIAERNKAKCGFFTVPSNVESLNTAERNNGKCSTATVPSSAGSSCNITDADVQNTKDILIAMKMMQENKKIPSSKGCQKITPEITSIDAPVLINSDLYASSISLASLMLKGQYQPPSHETMLVRELGQSSRTDPQSISLPFTFGITSTFSEPSLSTVAQPSTGQQRRQIDPATNNYTTKNIGKLSPIKHDSRLQITQPTGLINDHSGKNNLFPGYPISTALGSLPCSSGVVPKLYSHPVSTINLQPTIALPKQSLQTQGSDHLKTEPTRHKYQYIQPKLSPQKPSNFPCVLTDGTQLITLPAIVDIPTQSPKLVASHPITNTAPSNLLYEFSRSPVKSINKPPEMYRTSGVQRSAFSVNPKLQSNHSMKSRPPSKETIEQSRDDRTGCGTAFGGLSNPLSGYHQRVAITKPLSFHDGNDLKKELLLIQLKEYVRKHPESVNYIDTTKPHLNQGPVVYLSNSKGPNKHSQHQIGFRAMLPEHLWMDLINAGIARKDIEKVLLDSSNELQTKPPVAGATGNSKPLTNPSQDTNKPPVAACHVKSQPVTVSPLKHRIIHPTAPPINPLTSALITLPIAACPVKSQPTIVSPVKHRIIHQAAPPVNSLTSLPNIPVAACPLKSQPAITSPMKHRIIHPTAPPINSLTSSIRNLQQSKLQQMNQISNQNLIQHNIQFIQALYNKFVKSDVTSSSVVTLPTNTILPVHQLQRQAEADQIILSQQTANLMLKNSLLNNVQPPFSLKDLFPASSLANSSPVRVSFSAQQPTKTVTIVPSASPTKRKNKRIKMTSQSDDEFSPRKKIGLETSQKAPTSSRVSQERSLPERRPSVNEVIMDTEVDFCTVDMNIVGDEFVEKTMVEPLADEDEEEVKTKKKRKTNTSSKQRRNYALMLKTFLEEEERKVTEENETKLNFIISNDEGWKQENSSLPDIWKKLVEEINNTRLDRNIPTLPLDSNDVYEFFGLSKDFITHLVEQLSGGHKCRNYKFQHHLPSVNDDEQDLPENPSGCARGEIAVRKAERDMFAWLSSAYRNPPKSEDDVTAEDDLLAGGQDLPTAMKYRFLKNTAKDHVGVFRSPIQGRGLFCKKTIEAGDMIIEYSGETIRSVLTDKREDYYEKKGYGCYMFRIDSMDVVDATMTGNAARFINHACDPNCFSKIINVDGSKKIVIFATQRINVGEELTYDYKFAQEDDKLPCYCGSKKCRKYLN